MYALLLTWDLPRKDPTILQELRSYITTESWQCYRGVEGLVQKVWFSDEKNGVFGAFYLWENLEGLEQEVSTMYRIEQKTGVKPVVHRFEVEAIQEGNHQVERLLELGKIWTANPSTTTDRNG